jgi:hypothetical protein
VDVKALELELKAFLSARQKKQVRYIGLAFYHIKDKRIEAWPKNQTIFNANAHKVGEWITETKPAAAKTEKPPAKPADPAADPFGALG